MERTQISLTTEQAGELRRLARMRKTSVAALIREAIDSTYRFDPDRETRWERALASIGRFSSGLSDITERHDDYFAESLEW